MLSPACEERAFLLLKFTKMDDKKHFYLKFHTKDFRTDQNVCNCSPSAIGVYTFILCLLFDSPEKGKYLLKGESIKVFSNILLEQKCEQMNEQVLEQLNIFCLEIAAQLAKHFPYTEKEIAPAIKELLDNNVIYMEGNYLCQKRMIKDHEISKKRVDSGSKGGNKSNNKLKEAIELNKKFEEEKIILLKQIAEQSEQLKCNYNYNYNNTPHNTIVEEEISNNTTVTVGVDFQKKGTSGKVGNEITEKDEYLDYSLFASPYVCAWHYFNKPIGQSPKELAAKVLMNYFDGNMNEIIERLKLWAVEFNNYLGSISPEGRQMTGKNSYQSFFHNWLGTQGDKLKELPPYLQKKKHQTVKTKTAAEIIKERGL